MANTEYTEDQKLQAAMAYLWYGTTTKAGEVTGIPARTIRYWTTQDWWHDLLHMADTKTNDKVTAVQTRLMRLSTELLEQRLTEGDPIVGKVLKKAKTKTKPAEYAQEVVGFKPVSARDLAIIHAVITDKRNAIRGVKDYNKSAKTLDERLDAVTKRLEEHTASKKEQDVQRREIEDSLLENKPLH